MVWWFKGSLNFLTVLNMKEDLWLKNFLDKEYWHFLMARKYQVIGINKGLLVTDKLPTKKVIYIMDRYKISKSMDLDIYSWQMEVSTSDSLKTGEFMERVVILKTKYWYLKVIGKMDNWLRFFRYKITNFTISRVKE